MLTQIHIRNFAIIDEVELDLRSGMTVLTGETGAGKSILVDALGMVLGDRADADSVRHGQERADIAATFAIDQLPKVADWLKTHELDNGDECILRRVISAEGRSKGFINGSPAPLQLMKELGEKLVDIHGQHQHQSLLKSDVQRQQLDAFGGHQALAQQVSQLAREHQQCADKLNQLRQAARDRDHRLELLNVYVDELSALDLKPGELDELHTDHKRLANGEELMHSCQQALDVISDNDEANLERQLSRQLHSLQAFSDLDPQLQNIVNLLNESLIQLQEAGNELRHYVDSLDMNPERLQWLEQRLSAIHDVARKHRCEPEQLIDLQQQLSDELSALQNADVELDQLSAQLKTLEQDYLAQAKKLTSARKKAAKTLGDKVSAEIQQLGMPHGRFQVCLEARDEAIHRGGQERIIFEVSSNPGQPPRPLNKVASGGEMARISLAVQTLLATGQQIPTLIFDEVDTGIGGAVAETVGRLLRSLGNSHQVMCVTHLPQVAALGHNHLQVTKTADAISTSTQLIELNKQQRQEEIARMLGGMEITSQTRAHAEEMIVRAEALV